jgi:flavin reductase (DIM6/NTAB) family NADH-FMN oxidoreductase RutF
MPSAPSPDEFRSAMALVPTAVTVVTAPGAAGPAGATASAVTSLSLNPPLMLAALDRGSRTLTAVREAGRFGISVLAADQEEVARVFSTKAPHAEKWTHAAWTDRGGIPIVDGCALWVACELRSAHEEADHVILTGTALAIGAPGGDPLVFHDGDYRGLD